jgi:hypothetical protein
LAAAVGVAPPPLGLTGLSRTEIDVGLIIAVGLQVRRALTLPGHCLLTVNQLLLLLVQDRQILYCEVRKALVLLTPIDSPSAK